MKVDDKYRYLAVLAADARFKEHVLGWISRVRAEHTERVSSLTSSMESVRFSQGALDTLRQFEALLLTAKRQSEREKENE